MIRIRQQPSTLSRQNHIGHNTLEYEKQEKKNVSRDLSVLIRKIKLLERTFIKGSNVIHSLLHQ